MKVLLLVIMGVVFGLGCARVRVEAPKDPIKVDVSMRLDIYQHVVKDIDNIESMVSGAQGAPAKSDKQGWLNLFIPQAYAQEGLGPDIQQVISRRKDRRAELASWQEKGIVGENRFGFVAIMAGESSSPALEDLIKAENNDRMLIYQALAKKNGTSVEEVEKLYAMRLQQDASSGTPIEALNPDTASYAWQIKK